MMLSFKWKRKLKWLLLLILPIGLGVWLLVLREQRSRLPQVIYKTKVPARIIVSPDNNWLAVSASTPKSRRILIIDAHSGVLRSELPEPSVDEMWYFSGDSKQIIIADVLPRQRGRYLCRLTFYDVQSEKVQQHTDLPGFYYRDNCRLSYSALSNQIFALGTRCFVVDATSGKVQRTFTLADVPLSSIELSADSTTITTVQRRDEETKATENTAVHLWDAHNGKLLRTVGHKHSIIKRIAFSSDGSLIVADVALPPAPMTVQTWNLQNGRPLRNLKAPIKAATSLGLQFLNYPRQLQFSPTENLLAIPAIPDSVVLWNADTGKVERTLKGTRKTILADFCFSSDGKFLVTAMNNGNITRWRIR